LLQCDIPTNFNAAPTAVFFLYSAQYIACMPIYVGIPFMNNACLIFLLHQKMLNFHQQCAHPNYLMIDFCQQCAHPKKNGSREPEVFWMCALPQVGLCHIRAVSLAWGGL
jgi:hypothetical protein